MQGGMGGEANEMSMKISFRMMNDTMSSCFKDCVTDFRQESLSGQEKSCLNNCAKRSFGLMTVFGEIQERMASQQGGGQF